MKRPGAPGGLKFDIAPDAASMSRRAAQILVEQLKCKPDLLLCASAGGTPTGTYACLAAQAERNPKLFSKIRVLQIDEWAGLPPKSPATCESDLRSKLLGPLKISAERYAGFRSETSEPAAECARISRWLAANGPIDICILGLGLNGHIAMNEPSATALPHAHVAQLAASSRKHPLLKELARKPSRGLTLGLGDILRSRKILLLVSGHHKRAPLRTLFRAAVTPRFPASFLWLHSDATVCCDRQAAPTNCLCLLPKSSTNPQAARFRAEIS